MLKNNNPLTADLRRVESQTVGAISDLDGAIEAIANLSQTVNGLLQTRANTPAAPVGNLLFNGEEGHSVHTWFDLTPTPITPADKNCEDVFAYSNGTPANAKTFQSTDVNTTNETVTIADHGFVNGTVIDLLAEAGGTLPAPLAVLTTYFLIVVSPDELQFATTIGNAQTVPPVPINLTTTGTAAKTYTLQTLLLETDSRTSTTNNTLKTVAHTTFNPRYSKWDSTNGQIDITGTTSVDILMPSNFVDATTPLARVSLIAARANGYIEIPLECSFVGGIWDNTSGQRKFLTGDIGFDAVLVGTTDITERRFRAFYQSDRGFELLSDEITILNSPATLSDVNYIEMSWLQQSGQLQVSIYEHFDPSGVNEYRLVNQISSATSFIYEGDYLEVVSGYPVPTADVRTATFATQTADMSDLAINHIAPQWDTVNFPIGVPNNYNKGNTTNRQWVRLWMTVAANLYIPSGVLGDGSDTIIIPDGIVNSAAFSAGGYGTGGVGSSLYAGLSVDIYDLDDVLISSSFIINAVTSNTELVLSHGIGAGEYKMRLVAGGFHGIIIDKVNLGFQQNTSYVPNANDVRTLQPLAAPSSSSQGGVGTGGNGGGINPCIVRGTPVKMGDGKWMPVESGRPGQCWAAGQFTPNTLIKLRPGVDNVRRVRTSQGVEVVCTDTESFMVNNTDYKGTMLTHLRVGDAVFVEIDDRVIQDKIVEISPYLRKDQVFTPTLSDNRLFIAGELKLNWWQRFLNRIVLKRQVMGGIVLHNNKQYIEPDVT